MKNYFVKILLNAFPVLLMIILIPFVKNDYLLAAVYVLITVVFFLVKYESKEYIYFLFGFVVITFFEWVFVSTGAEIFQRRSLFGIMPIWLPIIWAYSFVAIKRSIVIINESLNEKSRKINLS